MSVFPAHEGVHPWGIKFSGNACIRVARLAGGRGKGPKHPAILRGVF